MTSRLDPVLGCLTPVGVEEPVLALVGPVEPRHLTGAAAALQRLAAGGVHRPRLVVGDPEIASYVARMRLGRALDAAGCRHDLPVVGERPQRGRLLEVEPLHGPDQARLLAGLVRERVRRRDRHAASVLWASVSEIGINVHEHAQLETGEAPVTGYVAAQTLRSSNEVVFAVADPGVGMLATLRGRGAVDDHHALALALTGTSRLGPGGGRGWGLRTTAELVVDLGGSLWIASGRATLTVTASGAHAARLPHLWAGTLVQGRIPLG